MLTLAIVSVVNAYNSGGYVPFDGIIKEVIKGPMPHTYITAEDLPTNLDWRNVNGTNYCSHVTNQKNPAVCGSCWAHATTGALSDRFTIATQGKLRVQLASQNLLNFNRGTSGGSCNGGDHVKAYDFIHQFGISDESCMPYTGLNWRHGFVVAEMQEVEDIQAHQCHVCDWSGSCGFAPRDHYDLYGVDEFGSVKGEDQMMAEIFARGPIACGLNSSPANFSSYKGGIITCDNGPSCHGTYKHLVVIAGWGVDAVTGMKYWIGRNSYGNIWGEGAGRGWFRLERGKDTLRLESTACSWAVPAQRDVERALSQFKNAI